MSTLRKLLGVLTILLAVAGVCRWILLSKDYDNEPIGPTIGIETYPPRPSVERSRSDGRRGDVSERKEWFTRAEELTGAEIETRKQRGTPHNPLTTEQRVIKLASGQMVRVELPEPMNPRAQTLAMAADVLMVKRKNAVDDAALRHWLGEKQLQVLSAFNDGETYVVRLPSSRLKEYDETLIQLNSPESLAEYGEPDFVRFAAHMPNDPSFAMQWALHNTGTVAGIAGVDVAAQEAWDVTRGDENIVVAVLDSGVDLTHPDLRDNLWRNTGEIMGNRVDDDGNGFVDDAQAIGFVTGGLAGDGVHGTHCAGILGARGNNSLGVTGIVPKIQLMSVMVMDSTGLVYDSVCIKGLDYASKEGAAVSSNSYGGAGSSKSVKAAISRAEALGMLCVVAAGNGVPGANIDARPSYPASYTNANVISVAASNAWDIRPAFSNYGNGSVDLAAPGVGILSTVPGGKYAFQDGTSMATPLVAGACALVKAAHPQLTWQDIKANLLATVDKLPAFKGKVRSGGRLNIARAVSAGALPRPHLTSLVVRNGSLPNARGHSDGVVTSGEYVTLQPTLTNQGMVTAEALTSRLTVLTPGVDVEVVSGSIYWGNVNPGAIITTNATTRKPFHLRIGGNVIPQTLDLLVEHEDGAGRVWTKETSLAVRVVQTVDGTVKALSGGVPIKTALVTFKGPVSGEKAVSANGSFSLDLPNGDYELTASATGYQSSPPQQVSLPPSTVGIDFLLGRPKLTITPGLVNVTLPEQGTLTTTLTVANVGDQPLNVTLQSSSLGNRPSSSYASLPSYGHAHGMAASLLPVIPWQEGFELGIGSLEPSRYREIFVEEDDYYIYYYLIDYFLGRFAAVTDTAAVGRRSLRYRDPYAAGFDNGMHRPLRYCRPAYVSYWVRPGNSVSTAGCFSMDYKRVYQYGNVVWTPVVEVKPMAGGQLVASPGVAGGDASAPFVPLTWHHVELRNMRWNTPVGLYDFWVNGTLVRADVPMHSNSGIDRVHFYNDTPDTECWWDEIRVLDTDDAWLSHGHTQLTLAPGETAPVTVTTNAENLRPGSYQARLHFMSNDPVSPVSEVPVTMKIVPHANQAPAAQDSTVVMDEDSVRAITLTSTDPDGDDITYTIKSLPKKGWLLAAPNAAPFTKAPIVLTGAAPTVYYMPRRDETGVNFDSFTWQAQDYRLKSRVAKLTIGVNPAPDNVIANDDKYLLGKNAKSLILDIHANDHNPDKRQFFRTAMTTPERGTVSVLPDGRLQYLPNADFSLGLDTFEYTIQDDLGAVDTARVVIGRQCPSLTFSISENEPIHLAMSGVTLPAGFRVKLSGLPSQGALYQTPDGLSLGNPLALGNSEVTHPKGSVIFKPQAYQSGQSYATFAFSITYTWPGSTWPQVFVPDCKITVHVASTPNAPVTLPDLVLGQAGSSVIFNPLANDFHPDRTSYRLTAVSQPSVGSVAINSAGQLEVAFSTIPSARENRCTYTVTDLMGRSAVEELLLVTDGNIGSDWPTVGGSFSHQGYSGASLPVGNLQEQWKQRIGGPAARTAIVEGKVVFSNPTDNSLICLDAASGSVLWRHAAPYPSSAPTVLDGRVFTTRQSSATYPYRTSAEAREIEDGSLLWSQQDELTHYNTISPPGILRGGIYPGFESSGFSSRIDYFSALPTKVDSFTYFTTATSPAAYKDQGLSVRGNEFGCQLRAWGGSGSTWQLAIGSSGSERIDVDSTVACAGDFAALIFDSMLYAIDLSAKTVAWRRSEISFTGSPAIGGGAIFGMGGNQVRVHNLAGNLVATYVTPAGTYLIGQPVVTPSDLIVTSSTQTFIFSLGTTTPRQTLPAGGYPSVADGSIFLMSADGFVRRFGIPDLASNPSPVAASTTVTTLEDTAVAIPLTVTDTGNFDVWIDSLPQHGQLYQTADGFSKGAIISQTPTQVTSAARTVIYEPAPNETGPASASFMFRGNDGESSSAVATLTVAITPVNDPPQSARDEYMIGPSESLLGFQPLQNDRDVDGDALSVVSFTQPTGGTVTTSSSAGLDFVPHPSFTSGSTSFTYEITDSAGEVSTTTVKVVIMDPSVHDWRMDRGTPAGSHFLPITLGTAPFVKLWEHGGVSSAGARVVGDRIHRWYSSDGGTEVDISTGGYLAVKSTVSHVADTSFYLGHEITAFPSLDLWRATVGGTPAWDFQVPVVSSSGPIVGSNGVLYGRADSVIHACVASTGLPVPGFTPIASLYRPYILDGSLFSFSSDSLQARDPTTSALQWTVQRPVGSNWGAPAFGQGYAGFSCASSNQRVLTCVDLTEHRVAWTKTTPLASSALCVAHDLLIESSSGKVNGYDLQTGLLVFQYTLPPSLSDNIIGVIATNDSLIVWTDYNTAILDIWSGTVRQSINAGRFVCASGTNLVLSDGLVAYAASVPSGSPPSPQPQTVTTAEDTDVLITLSATDDMGSVAGYIISSLPTKGVLYQCDSSGLVGQPLATTLPAAVDDAQGRLFYRPPLNAHGNSLDSFGFKASDGILTSAAAIVTVHVTPLNDPPIAASDRFLVQSGEIISPLQHLANDLDPDGDAVFTASFTQPHIGQVSQNSDGTLRYQSDPAVVTGTTSFSYTAVDPSGVPSTATVAVVYGAESDPNWTMHGGSAAHAGFSQTPSLLTPLIRSWSTAVDAGNRPLVLAESRVFSAGLKGNIPALFALSQSTGDGIWSKEVRPEPGNDSELSLSAPIYESGTLFFHSVTLGAADYYPYDLMAKTMFGCVEAHTGNWRWRITLPNDLTSTASLSPPLSAMTRGMLAPRFSVSSVGRGYAAYQNGYCGLAAATFQEPHRFAFYDQVTDQTLWSSPLGTSSYETPIFILDDKAYFKVGNPSYSWVCMSLSSRSELWRGAIGSSPAYAAAENGMIYTFSNGAIRVHSADSGQQLRTFPLSLPGSVNQSHAIVLTEQLLLLPLSNGVHVFDRFSGAQLQTLPETGPVAVAQGRVFISGIDDVTAYVIPAAVTFTPGSSLLTGPTNVTLSSPGTGATIRYTTDGSAPTLSSNAVASGSSINVTPGTTVRAIAIVGSRISSIFQADYTIATPLPIAGALAQTSLLDSDGDGASNQAEAIAGTNPNNGKDVFKVTSAIAEPLDDTVSITWPSATGRSYTVQLSHDLSAWVDASASLVGTGETMSYSISRPKGKPCFIRVRLD